MPTEPKPITLSEVVRDRRHPARAEFDGRPNPAIARWLEERGISE